MSEFRDAVNNFAEEMILKIFQEKMKKANTSADRFQATFERDLHLLSLNAARKIYALDASWDDKEKMAVFVVSQHIERILTIIMAETALDKPEFTYRLNSTIRAMRSLGKHLIAEMTELLEEKT